jgi:flagellar hook-length control protein FliK
MKATALPAQVNSAPTNVEPVSAATADSGSDFVGMLMQLLGGNAPTTLPGAAVKGQTLKSTDADTETEDLSALAAMMAVPAPVPLPWTVLPSVVTDGGSDPLELLGLSASGSSSAQSLLTLASSLTDTLADPSADAGGDTNDSIGSLSPFADALQTRSQSESLVSRPLHVPVGTSQWADELGTRLTWMVDRGHQAASLRLSPDHLGPLEVRISITDDKASVWFGAAHADTRAAIEHALPRLREMFAAQGLSLADAGVFREPPRDQSTPVPRSFAADTDAGQREGEVMISTRGIGLVDAYA